MKDQQINTFGKGMMKDLGVTLPQEGSYVDAQNIRIISDGLGGENGSGIVIDVKGNEKVLDLTEINVLGTVYPEQYTLWVETGSLTPSDLALGLGVGVNQVITWEAGTYLYVEPSMWYNASAEDIDLPIALIDESEETGGTSYILQEMMQSNLAIAPYGEINVPYYSSLDDLDNISNAKIIGHTIIRDTLVLFTIITLEDFLVDPRSVILSCNLNDPTLSASLVYMEDLGFDPEYPIEAIGRYESEEVQRVYWTDNLNPVRTLNVINTQGIDITDLELAPSILFNKPKVSEVLSTGNLLGGMYQYGYRLKTTEGAESRVSPLTGLVHVVHGTKSAYWNYNSDPENTDEYSQALLGETTNKAVVIKLTDLDLNYNKVELIAIHKTSAYGVASAHIVGERQISASGEVSITHRSLDNTIPITIEEVTAFNVTPTKAKTIATKDNRLFLGNCANSTDYLKFNARAYRYKRTDGASNHPFLEVEGDNYATYADDTFDPLAGYASGEDPYPPEFNYTLNENLNAINPFNLEASSYEEKYKYSKDGITLGGEGPNVSYKFIKKKLQGNTAAGIYVPGELQGGNNQYPYQTSEFVIIPPSPPYVSGSFSTVGGGCDESVEDAGAFLGDYKDPLVAEGFKGYHREELYRFGVVLYDLKGNPGFVNWIGDIKFPTYSDYDINKGEGICNFTISQSSGSGGLYYHPYGVDAGTLGNDASLDNDGTYDGATIEEINNSIVGELQSVTNQSVGSSHTYLFALGVEFTVNIPDNIKPFVSGYSVVRCERERADKTVLGMGPLTFMHSQHVSETGSTRRYVLPIRNAYHGGESTPAGFYGESIKEAFTIDSPDFAFTGDYPAASPCSYISVVGGFAGIRQEDFNNSEKFDAQIGGAHMTLDINDGGGGFDIGYSSYFGRGDIIFPSGAQGLVSYIGDDNFKGFQNRSLYASLGSSQTQSDSIATSGVGENTLLVITKDSSINWENYFSANLNETLPEIGSWEETKVNQKGKIIAAIKKDPTYLQYGGNTYASRKSNVYLSTGSYSKKNTPVSNVWGGDTYVTIYDLEKLKKHNGDNDPYATVAAESKRRSVSVAFPVETAINTTLRSGYHFANKTDWEINGEQQYNEFELDSVYSAEADSYRFIPEPLDFSELTLFDHKIAYSNSKVNGSLTDGWRKFKLENAKNVEGEFGAITKLIVNQDNMFFLQDRGFGQLSINPTSTVVDSDGTSIVLGTGSVIQDFKYYSTTVGAQDVRSIVNTTKGIYWVDKKTKKAYAFRANGLDSISDTHGMKSWFSSNIDKDSKVVLGNDVINDEVLFSVGDETLAFSEVLNKFTSFYTYGTPMYINTFDRLFSIDPNNLSDMYEHNIGESKTFYGEENDSYIEFLVNKHPIHTKVFDIIEWYTASNTNMFDSATFSNSNPSDTQGDDLSEAASKERTTRMPVPRTSAQYRFRDAYMKVRLTTSQEFTLHYVKTSFRISKR